MRAYPVPFTASGVIETSSSDLIGVSFVGFTAVAIYNGADANAPLAFYCPAPGAFGLSYELVMDKGLYVQVTGTGKGSLWLA